MEELEWAQKHSYRCSHNGKKLIGLNLINIMIKITLDTSCIDKRVTKELNELKKLYEENKIQVWMFEASFWEKMQYKNRILQLRDLAWMMSFIDEDRYAHEIPKGKTIDDVEPFDREKYGQIYKKVSEIHSPEFKGGKYKASK